MTDDFLSTTACDDVYLIWVDSGHSDYLFSPQELREYVSVEAVTKRSDGTLYHLTSLDQALDPEC